jgi:hypothetical protein
MWQVPEHTRSNLHPSELSKMIIGDDDVDVSRWKSLCSGDYAGDEVVGWFWEHMESCSAAERMCVLQWTTGYSRLPYHTSDKYERSNVAMYVARRVTICACTTCAGTGTPRMSTRTCRRLRRATGWDSWCCPRE